MKKVKITLTKDGTSHIEVLGASGEECIEFTKELEHRLGTAVGDRELKSEYYETAGETEQQHEAEQ